MSDIMRQKASANSNSAYVQIDTDATNGKSKQSETEAVILWCFDLSTLSRSWQFVILTALTFVLYLIYGYMQELIFKLEGFKPFGWYLTLVQFAYYTIFGLVELQIKSDKERRIPIMTYLLLAFLTVATMGLSNTSLGYLNYPTQVIFKCCKLIPVLIGGILIQGKKFSAIDVSACLCMSVGLTLFTLADSTVSPNFNLYGVILISLALCADGVIGNVQEKTLKQYSASNGEMVTSCCGDKKTYRDKENVLFSYGIGFVYILVGLFVTGSFSPAYTFCKQYPKETYGYAIIFSLTGYLGLYVVLTLVKSFGALIAVTVTTCRKAVTIVLSFIFFTKPFTLQYIWSGLVVILGIYLNLYSKNKVKWDSCIFRQLQKFNLIKRKPFREPLDVV